MKELVDKVRPSQIAVGDRDREKFFLVISALKSHHFLVFELPVKSISKKTQTSTKNSFQHRNSKLHVSFQKSALRQYLLLPLNRNCAKKHESNRNSMFCTGGGNVKLHIFHRTQRISFLYSEHSNSGLVDYKG